MKIFYFLGHLLPKVVILTGGISGFYNFMKGNLMRIKRGECHAMTHYWVCVTLFSILNYNYLTSFLCGHFRQRLFTRKWMKKRNHVFLYLYFWQINLIIIIIFITICTNVPVKCDKVCTPKMSGYFSLRRLRWRRRERKYKR